MTRTAQETRVRAADAERRDALAKWHTPEEPRRYHGWSIISPVPDASPALRHGGDVLAALRRDVPAGELTRHPASSLHMTVAPGMSAAGADGADGTMPRWVTPGMTHRDRALGVLHRLTAADLPPVGPVDVTVREVTLRGTAAVVVDPVDGGTLERFRAAVWEAVWGAGGSGRAAAATPGERAGDGYRFHVTLAYRLRDTALPDDRLRALEDRYLRTLTQDGPVLRLDPPAFSVFDNMVAFPPLLRF